MPCQTYEYQGEDENSKSAINVLWCNFNRWGAQENHYDLLYPIIEREEKKNTFVQTFKEKEGELDGAGSYKANYVGRRIKGEAERGTNITTLNVSGSLQDFEWVLEHTEDHIVLIQEHW
eukprot:14306496-Heterocapsa_arctica.AAC.1